MTCLIDLGNPVNRASPLNQGLLAWYRRMPNTCGTKSVLDLCGQGSYGFPQTLTNGTTNADPTAFWSPRGKYIDFDFPGGSPCPWYAKGDSNNFPDLGDLGLTASLWYYCRDVSTYNVAVDFNHDSYGQRLWLGSAWGYMMSIGPGGQANSPTAFMQVGSLYHFAYVYTPSRVDGGTAYLYCNGQLVTSHGGHSPPRDSNMRLGLGARVDGYNGMTGGVGSVKIHGRVFSSDDVMSLYQEELAGNPTTLNYYSPRSRAFITGVSAPVNTVAPAVTGTVQVGQTLTTTNGTWSGSPTSYAYQWKRADNAGFTTNVTNIGTNQNTFVLTASESGKYVRCVVTATNAGGSTDANSNIVGDVLPAAPTNTVAPSCSPSSGTTADLFVFSSGTWTGSPTSWDWEYRTAGSGAWSALSGVQDPTIAGSVFGVGSWNTRVTATNAGGSTTANGTTITVTQPVPVNTVAPAVTPTSGSVGEVFSCTTGTWTNSPTGYSYQWKLDGANVGTNSNTYTPVASGSLTCTVTASNAGGAGTPAVSNTATVTAAGGVAILGGGFFS